MVTRGGRRLRAPRRRSQKRLFLPPRKFLRLALAAAMVTLVPGAFARSRPSPLSVPSATDLLDGLFAGMRLFWGDVHAHTAFSDGFGTPRQLYEHARGQRHLDFCAETDHAEWINYFQSRLQMTDGSPLPLWANIVAEADAQYVPGAFVTFAGFEYTNDDFGHRNVIFRSTADLPAVLPSAYTHPTPEDLFAALEPYEAITIAHHPTRWGHRMDWSRVDPRTDRLTEIYSKWGNGASVWTPYELPTKYRQYPFLRRRAAESGVDAMLATGHRIGIIAGSDSHQGMPGSTSVDRPLGIPLPADQYPKTGEAFLQAVEQGYRYDLREPSGGGGGLAAVWATDLTREVIWDALYARRTFGTTGIRPVVKFGARDSAALATGTTMGGELVVTGSPVLYASASPGAGSGVTELMILKNNEVLFAARNPLPGEAVSVQDDQLGIGETAVYTVLILLRQGFGTNADGDTILTYSKAWHRFFLSPTPRLDEQVWTSPVWVTHAAP